VCSSELGCRTLSGAPSRFHCGALACTPSQQRRQPLHGPLQHGKPKLVGNTMGGLMCDLVGQRQVTVGAAAAAAVVPFPALGFVVATLGILV